MQKHKKNNLLRKHITELCLYFAPREHSLKEKFILFYIFRLDGLSRDTLSGTEP